MHVEAVARADDLKAETMKADSLLPVDALEASIAKARAALLSAQKEDGHWIFELESDAWTPVEYALLPHFLGETPNTELERKISHYLRRTQLSDGGWPMATDGAMDVSLSVKAYFALKMMGERPDAEHMLRAREAILAAGGAETCNVFARFLLALFGVLSWSAVPIMPVEIMLLPNWFPFHIYKMAYWARTMVVPLLVLSAKRPLARNPHGIRIDELFQCEPQSVGLLPRAPHQSKGWFAFFRVIDSVLRLVEPLTPTFLRKRAINSAVAFVEERLNGEDGLGALFPPMFYTVLMYDTLGYPPDHPNLTTTRRALDKLLVIHEEEAYCQPCLSPVWDTVLSAHALMETGDAQAENAARRALQWILPRQVLDLRGDWAWNHPDLRPGGWAFEYMNPFYPDLDDTAVIVMAMHRADSLHGETTFTESIERAKEWVLGMQSEDGGWAAFDVDNTCYYLNNIPFSDHGALLDPPTADVTARCLSMLAQLGEVPPVSEVSRRAMLYLLNQQMVDGSWFGRWGMNYIYGTWSALSALNAAGVPHDDPRVRRAVVWLVSIQNPDGGWGEDAVSYRLDFRSHESAPSTASQTSWALLGLMAAGEVNHPAVARGIVWLRRTQREHGFWDETRYTACGFPRVMYLRYHGYRKYFPLMALARYRNLKRGGSTCVKVGF